MHMEWGCLGVWGGLNPKQPKIMITKIIIMTTPGTLLGQKMGGSGRGIYSGKYSRCLLETIFDRGKKLLYLGVV